MMATMYIISMRGNAWTTDNEEDWIVSGTVQVVVTTVSLLQLH